MRVRWLLATRSWSASPGRTVALVVSVALGVAVVVSVTGVYETARDAIVREVMTRWLGNAHLNVYPPGGHWGTLDAAVASKIARLDNVDHVTSRLRRRMRLVPSVRPDTLLDKTWRWVDAVGIVPETELHFRTFPRLEGRLIRSKERGVVIVEQELAATWAFSLGSRITLSPYQAGRQLELRVIGLFDSQRVAEFAPPTIFLSLEDVQLLAGEPGAASAIDVMLNDVSPTALQSAKRSVEEVIAGHDTPYPYRVETAASRQILLNEAEKLSRLQLVLVAFIALLTSFFIILTTMSMSIFERRVALGVTRCVGMTRGQLAGLLVLELVPLGLVGTALGMVAGIALARLASYLAGGDFNLVTFSWWGLGLGAGSGVVTTLVSTTALIAQVCRVTPLTAVHSQARPARLIYPLLAGLVGVALIVCHELIVRAQDQTQWLTPSFAIAGVTTLYLGYILIAPALVVIAGPLIARLVGPLLGIRARLAEDPFRRAPWRSTGVCWVLMVGLSLIVYIGVSTEAVLAVWDFPARLPEAFLWSRDYIPRSAVEEMRKLPGVGPVITTTDVECRIETPRSQPRSVTDSLVRMFVSKLTRPVFVASDPDQVLGMIKIAFLEGAPDEAKRKLKRGGYVLIPAQTSRNRNLHLGDRITVTVGKRSAEFEIAGVVQSPALDIAVTAFQATSYMQIAAASAVLGTEKDLTEKFGMDVVSMVMCNLELPESAPPPGFDPARMPDYTDRKAVAKALIEWGENLPNERGMLARIGPQLRAWLAEPDAAAPPSEVQRELRRFGKAIQRVCWAPDRQHLTRGQAWELLRERLVLLKMARALDRPGAIMGSLRRLKMQFDRNLRRATTILTWLPTFLLAIAAIGIGNLMMVSVQIRSREIAILRAVGALKSQIVRLVLAEAIALGLIGSIMGLALGFHEAISRNRIVADLIGFEPEFIVPLGTLALAVGLTVLVCLLAGIAPARRAARNNIIEAMQTT